MTGRISRGWQLFKATFGILKAEKSLILFPVISAVLSLLVLIVFIFPALMLFSSTGANTDAWGVSQWAMWVVFLFVFYFVIYLITIFFKGAVISNAPEAMNGISSGRNGEIRSYPDSLSYCSISRHSYCSSLQSVRCSSETRWSQ